MDGNVQHVVKQVSTFDGKNADDFLEWSSKLRISLSLYSNLIYKIVQGSQRPSDLDNDQTTREGRDDANHDLFSTSISLRLAQLSLSCGGSKERHQRKEYGTDKTYGQLYARSSTAARARPCERRTEKWKL